jgi:hypothetical protein
MSDGQQTLSTISWPIVVFQIISPADFQIIPWR